MLKKMGLMGLAAVALATLPATAQATSIVTNGGLAPAIDSTPVGSFTTLPLNSTVIPGWTVTKGTVDYIHTYWTDQGGDGYSVDLSGNGPGALTQLLNTIAGQAYNVVFYLGGNLDGPPPIKDVLVTAANGSDILASQLFSYTGTGSGHFSGWNAYSFYFTAASDQTSLTFESKGNSAFGAGLDSISASAVPELGSWAMLLVGFGVLGVWTRRRRSEGGLVAAF